MWVKSALAARAVGIEAQRKQPDGGVLLEL